jgi:hypothetical protein
MVAHQIKAHWRELFAGRTWHSKSDLSGILRTILSSVKVRSHPGPDSQGYLVFIERFLGKLGVNVRRVNKEDLPPGIAAGEGADQVLNMKLEDKERE